MITLRGAERPSKVKWTRPFLAHLEPLSNVAARQTFVEVADDGHDDASIKELLELTGNLPLAVSLIASVAGSEGCAQALSCWKLENTRMLSEGYDQRSSLDISIMLSYTSSRMTSGAQEFLSILSLLPDGLADADLIYSPKFHEIWATSTLFSVMGLSQKDQILSTILRAFCSSIVSTIGFKTHIHPCYCSFLDKWGIGNTIQFLGNILFKYCNVLTVFLSWISIATSSRALSISNRKIHWNRLISHQPDGTVLWESTFSVEGLIWADALKYYQRAYALAESIGYPTIVGIQPLTGICDILIVSRKPLSALTHANEAYRCAEQIGNMYGQAESLYLQGRCHTLLANYGGHTQCLLHKSRHILATLGQQSVLELTISSWQAEIHLVAIASSCQPTSYNAIMANLNMVFIDIATGADSKNHSPKSRQGSISFEGIDLPWTGIEVERKRQTTQALRCLSQIFSTERDDETALSVFTVALDGFAFMGVHQWRADCMVRIANILNNRGEVLKAIELWKAARPLFERSSQMMDIVKIDAKLAEVDSAVLADYEEQLQ
ncbi:hypothetical protein C8J57DRAFT_1568846 [Mycena rebaudengoi]|nr:hypothetical protein C8J57DRAFT_1568846 [Mycena rebaudengoi]